MEISVSEILAPADILVQLLFLPKVAYFCAFFAYEGIKNGETLTHVGMRKGTVARLYGVFYLLFVIFSIATFPLFTKMILETEWEKMEQALLFAIPLPPLGFVFIGIAVFAFVFRELLVKFSRKKIRNNGSARKIYNSMILFPLAIGVQTLIGLPHWVNVAIFVFFIYFSPLASPKEIRQAMSIPTNEKFKKQKAPSPI